MSLNNVYCVIKEAMDKLLEYLHENKHICQVCNGQHEFRNKFKFMIKDSKTLQSEQTEDDTSELEFYLQNPIDRRRYGSFRVFNPGVFLQWKQESINKFDLMYSQQQYYAYKIQYIQFQLQKVGSNNLMIN
ncbi:unnamed protein product (macronuclear) [Paramecium tetraurelia]|uniref:Uncharacterized protein n=1 Tax=Paramecium tetraurelia TaxID=5888 RepID=A0C089_PARTE|nr:uncharacterized protein GSPATT00006059001 [Paramecium tetraurelia]CAK64206.1 unnamed protein product [Paramecium tetraurelia]|eukprot:XP_001431604.1 hypothetical protein (macronuclear) [Paramecium tetraurelia strain d4-2]